MTLEQLSCGKSETTSAQVSSSRCLLHVSIQLMNCALPRVPSWRPRFTGNSLFTQTYRSQPADARSGQHARVSRAADRFTHAAYSDWEREHTALRAWLDRSRSVVSCGGRLAPSCSACSSNPSDCLGDCVWIPGWITAGSCTEIEPGETLPPNLGGLSRSSSANSEPVQVVDSSPLSTALLTMVLAGAPGSGCSRQGGASPCVPLHNVSGLTTVSVSYSDVQSAARAIGHCACPNRQSPSGAWLHSSMTGAVRSSTDPAAHVALLRDPVEALAAEWLPHPELACEAAAGMVGRFDGRCSASTLSALAGAEHEVRVATFIECCANLMSRHLVAAALSPTSTTRRCATGGCSPEELWTLAWRALLRLRWFGTLRTLRSSLVLLERTLQRPMAPLDEIDVLALQSPTWPFQSPTWPMEATTGAQNGAQPSARVLTDAQVHAWRNASAVDVRLYEAASGLLAWRLRTAGLDAGRPLDPYRYRPAWKLSHQHAALAMVSAARVFGTDYGPGRVPAVVVPPVPFRPQHDTFVFIHMAKCGGTSFNGRLTTLRVAAPLTPAAAGDDSLACECSSRRVKMHNGHAVVQPRSCSCPREEPSMARSCSCPREEPNMARRGGLAWSEYAEALPADDG